MIRFGLCCQFYQENIKFRTTTATSVLKLNRKNQLAKISSLCLENATNLLQALIFCSQNNIGCFRVNSQILPLKTHPAIAYEIADLPEGKTIEETFRSCRDFLQQNKLRASFHPDQFVVLNSPNPETVKASIAEIEYQTQLAILIGADVVNIHAGGGYGNKTAAIQRFSENFTKLSENAQKILTLENDDKTWSPAELLPVCRELKIPLVYDVHHHRCLKDNLSIEEATIESLKTWNREPMFHISSPQNGWDGNNLNRHHDYIDARDFPQIWKNLDITVEIEAKAKEKAILKLIKDLKIS